MDDVLKYAKLFKQAVENPILVVRESPIHGAGAFSLSEIESSEVFYTRTLDHNPEFGGFNHADEPNAKMMSHHPHHGTKVLALKDIHPGDEITVQYPDTSAFEE